MGAFNNYVVAQKATLAGQIPIGGTFVPTSEYVPMILAQNVKGGFMVLPDVATLADIPYELLQLWMEVTIAEAPDINRTKYILYNMPPANTKVNEIIDYVLTSYWQEVVNTEPIVVPGPQGEKGWAPSLALEDDGDLRTVHKIVDYVGGTGTKPSLPELAVSYLGTSGFTTKTLAKNLKPSPPAAARPEYYISAGTKKYEPLNSADVALAPNVWVYASSSLTIQNTHSVARRFRIRAEACVADGPGAGGSSWQVNLLSRSDASWPVNPFGGGTTVDQQYSRQEYVDSGSYPSIHKIVTEYIVQLSPLQSVYVRINMVQSQGVSSLYTQGFIEAFGL